ncbi:MAG: sulfatase-like hydrolase/transferase [Thermoguttaceae bacterium]
MKPRFALLLAAVLTLRFVPAGPCLAADQSPPAGRPNILWLVSEDTSPLLGCYGDPLARTPRLDRLARDGVLYERCFAQPVCAPSRFALISGMFAASCGPAHHMRAQGRIPAWLRGFPALLQDAGYHTSNNAKTDYNSPISVADAWDASGAKAHWRHLPSPNQPFFSVFNHAVTHESCLFPKKELPLAFPPSDPAAMRIPPYLPDTPEIRADAARCYNHITLMDRQVADKLKELEEAGLAQDTIVFYYGDNGGILPRSKQFLQRTGTHVPLIVYYPPKWRHLSPGPPGSRISDPVSFVDFAPTVLSLAGVKIPEYMQGRALAGPARAPAPDFVFGTRDRMDELYDMMRSVMDRRWLYVRNYRPDIPYVEAMEYMFKARGYQSWARVAAEGRLTPATAHYWGEKPVEELYDMDADPDNVVNLAGDPTHRETLERMRAALRRHTLEINDNGFLPEGSPLEGYDASRDPGAYPLDRVFEIATLASDRDPRNLPRLTAALEDPCEPIRWWAAQGCAMLRRRAAPAQAALEGRLDDPSGAVQIAAAEALARIGRADAALPVLNRWLQKIDDPPLALQAANVLGRLGPIARPSLSVMQRVLHMPAPAGDNVGLGPPVPHRVLRRVVPELEGRRPPLVYP